MDFTTGVRLPKLSIRPFNSDMTMWTTFWDSFASVSDGNTSLSQIDKFNYLRSLVEKSAAEAISRLILTADNYKEAVTILKRRCVMPSDISRRMIHLNTVLEHFWKRWKRNSS